MRLLKFNAVGAIGMAVHVGLLLFLVQVCGMHYLLATALAVEAAVLHNFVWHWTWTWADRPIAGLSALAAALLRFNLTNGSISVVGNLLLMRLFAGTLGYHPLLATLLSISLCALFNYLVSDRWVFAPSAPAPLCRGSLQATRTPQFVCEEGLPPRQPL